MSNVSVVIPILKPPAERLNKCLRAVIDQADEIVVVQDRRGTIPAAAIVHHKINYVVNQTINLGFGGSCDVGALLTNDRFIWFLNDDCYPAPDCFKKLLEVMLSYDRIGIVGHELRYPNGMIQHGGTARARDGIGFRHRDQHQLEATIKEPTEMECVTGASILVRRQAFLEVSGFSEDYEMYCEDFDLCLKLRQKGWKVFYTPYAKAVHESGGSSKDVPNLRPIIQRSMATFRERWGSYFQKNRGNPGLGIF